MKKNEITFDIFLWRMTALHMITYFIFGILAMVLFDYQENFENGVFAQLMKPISSPWITAGPGLQLIRGIIFATVLWPFKSIFLFKKNGWIKLWGLILGLAILNTSGPAPGSVEGLIYTKIPFWEQILSLRETVVQTFVFCWLFWKWYQKPHKAWNIIGGVLVGLIIFFSGMGLLVVSG